MTRRIRIIRELDHEVGEHHYVTIRILFVPRCREYPQGVKYTLTLLDTKTNERVFGIDNQGGHGHHMHVNNEIRPYWYVNVRQLHKDFWAHTQVILDEETSTKD